MEFPVVKNPLASEGDVKSLRFGKIPWRRKWQLTPVFLPGEPHEQRSLGGYSLWVAKESGKTECACMPATDASYLKSTEGFGIPRFSRCVS